MDFVRLQNEKGRRAERRAEALLRAAGLRVLARNVRTKSGEIDLVALESGVFVVVEVRHRGPHLAAAFRSVGAKKRRILRRVAREARIKLGLPRGMPVRFDVVISSDEDPPFHLRGAFAGRAPFLI